MSDAETLLADLLSADSPYWAVVAAARTIVKTRDERILSFLAAKRGDIAVAMDSAEDGRRRDLEDVLKKLAFAETRDGCWCAMYPRFACFHATEERDTGHVAILQQTLNVPFKELYVCKCVVCGTRYGVEEDTDLHAQASKWFTKQSLLADLLSGDAYRVRSATRQIIPTRDADVLTLLASRKAEIEAATTGLDFATMPWMRSDVEFVLAKLSFFASRAGCLCKLYPSHNRFVPVGESLEGRVSIVKKTDSQEPDRGPDYVCKCADCGTRYDVQEYPAGPSWVWRVHEPSWRFWRTR